VSIAFPATGSYIVTLVVTDDDGAQATVTQPVQVTAVLHSSYAGTTTKWSSKSGSTNYWSADVTVAVHGADERPIAGATVTAVWSGAVNKTVTCVSSATGDCTFKSGTLSYLRSAITLSVTAVVAADSIYDTAGNHYQGAPGAGGAITLVRP
jgi:hypothetical protein